MNFAHKLQSAMDNAGIRAIDLAAKTNISRSTISQYLSGAFLPKQQNIFKIATALKISPSSLIDFGEIADTNFWCKENSKSDNYRTGGILTKEEIELLSIFRKLNSDISKGKAIAKIEILVEQQENEKAEKKAKAAKIKRSC